MKMSKISTLKMTKHGWEKIKNTYILTIMFIIWQTPNYLSIFPKLIHRCHTTLIKKKNPQSFLIDIDKLTVNSNYKVNNLD